MTDIATVWIAATGQGDWSISAGALAAGDDLASAVLISLFTDRQADDSDTLPDGSTDRRGWWGDVNQDVIIGSRLWLLQRSRLDEDVVRNAVIYAKEALQWLLDDGVASAITVTPTIVGSKQLDLAVSITRKTGTSSYRFAWAWAQVAA